MLNRNNSYRKTSPEIKIGTPTSKGAIFRSARLDLAPILLLKKWTCPLERFVRRLSSTLSDGEKSTFYMVKKPSRHFAKNVQKAFIYSVDK